MKRVFLTPPRIAKATCPEGKAQAFLFDDAERGMPRLAVRITAKGKKTFVFETKINRSSFRTTIGLCSGITIEKARIEARRLQRMIDKGIDPREHEREEKERKAAEKAERKRQQDEAEKAIIYSLKALCETYADHLEAQGKIRPAANARSAFKVHLFESHPIISGLPAKEITPHQVASVIRPVIEAGKERTASVLRSYLLAAYNCSRKAPFDAKLPSDFIPFEIENNPVEPVATIPNKPRNRTLNTEELKKYLESLGGDLIDQTLKLALYAGGQRMAQLLRAEIKDFDPDTKTLRLMDPKGRRSAPREHLLPLGFVAAGIVEKLIEKAKQNKSPSLFGSRGSTIHYSTPGKRVLEISSSMGSDPFDLRDLRRTAETMLAGLGISRDTRAQLLSHGISGVQATHYDRHEYTDEKRQALLKWERHLLSIMTGKQEKIVKIGREK